MENILFDKEANRKILTHTKQQQQLMGEQKFNKNTFRSKTEATKQKETGLMDEVFLFLRFALFRVKKYL